MPSMLALHELRHQGMSNDLSKLIGDICVLTILITSQVVDTALREDFGFQQLLWVYSGRRGVHCWVCDHRARMMSNEARSAVAENLHVVKGTGFFFPFNPMYWPHVRLISVCLSGPSKTI